MMWQCAPLIFCVLIQLRQMLGKGIYCRQILLIRNQWFKLFFLFFFLNFLFHLFSKFTLSIFSLSLPLSLSFSVHPLHLYRRCFLFPSHFFSALDETLTRRCPPFFCSNPQEFSPFLLKSAGVLDETPVTIKRSHPLLPSPFFPLKPCSGSSRMLPSAAAKFVRERGIRSDQKEEKR